MVHNSVEHSPTVDGAGRTTVNVSFNLNRNVVLQGGWDCGHVGKWTSPAFIDGTITVSGGSVVFDNVVVL